ncbi:hypothetical protein NPIL_76051 [Nephila pilipes]|uniref:EGF-like domain-containing protein n=1 Tax=Nephila pilipes TaxID=299642 RepID=A0A8X6IYK3_NEPPI|nr:hypothetical protein NPIL_76051 [Nephila pilipes]
MRLVQGSRCNKDIDCHHDCKCNDIDCKCISKENDQKVCECKKGTSGAFCKDVEECVADPFMCGNGTDVRCVFDVVREEAMCKCDNSSKSFDANAEMCRSS